MMLQASSKSIHTAGLCPLLAVKICRTILVLGLACLSSSFHRFCLARLFAFAAALAEALGLGPDGGSAAAAVVAWVGVGSDVASVASLAAGAAASVAASSGEAPSTAAAAGGGGEGPGPAHDNKGEVSGAAASSCAFSSLSPSVCVMSSSICVLPAVGGGAVDLVAAWSSGSRSSRKSSSHSRKAKIKA
eukprot:CAMPEP_0206598868 /NCGR_PEP_ID=MMETSP0325_2-20121206/44868_1 /ASSEMBLY_ACC=CAM_ASM_000347 /TAXON_ID=2866 /ORGANISM="Crypthecodinium cohnii, Strain Seligo" /LENGTH=188 /DNA_ID=CAMNT_0054109887 /DNA_START=364 /DNA_END=933 /DNA_ORIENTATION=-